MRHAISQNANHQLYQSQYASVPVSETQPRAHQIRQNPIASYINNIANQSLPQGISTIAKRSPLDLAGGQSSLTHSRQPTYVNYNNYNSSSNIDRTDISLPSYPNQSKPRGYFELQLSSGSQPTNITNTSINPENTQQMKNAYRSNNAAAASKRQSSSQQLSGYQQIPQNSSNPGIHLASNGKPPTNYSLLDGQNMFPKLPNSSAETPLQQFGWQAPTTTNTLLNNRPVNGINRLNDDNSSILRRPDNSSRNHLRNIVKYSNPPHNNTNNGNSNSQLQSFSAENQSIKNNQETPVTTPLKPGTNNTTGSPKHSSGQLIRPPSTNTNSFKDYVAQQGGIMKSSSYTGAAFLAKATQMTQQESSSVNTSSRISKKSNSTNNSNTINSIIGNSAHSQSSNLRVKTQNNDLLDARMIPKIDKSKISSKSMGVIQAYAANTHQGLVRGYNEDRVSIILNMVKPNEKSTIVNWPNICFFAIYDGHGGAMCADYLRDQLHLLIIQDQEFPGNPDKAIQNGFKKAEDTFLQQADSVLPFEKSGSCAIVAMFVNDKVYIANLGDSRAVMSSERGKKVIELSVDHKPNFPGEEKRILENGGRIYQSQIPTLQPKNLPQFIKGPHRVLPGRLAVSRTIGDAEAKIRKYGGNPRVVSCEPEVSSFILSQEHDFILLGCDGIFDKLTSNESIEYLWQSLREKQRLKEMRIKSSIHDAIGDSVENLIRETFIHKSFDNLTVVVICLKSLEKLMS